MATDVPTEEVTKQVEELQVEESGEGSGVSPTVLRSTEDFSVTHPLSHRWTLWYTKPSTGQSGEDWKDLLKQIVTVSTVEEFWGAFNSIPKIEELQLKSDYSFFKDGIRPEWEDPHNGKGGRLMYVISNKTRNQPPGPDGQKPVTGDEAWLKVLLGVIGGTLDNDKEIINGIFINVRKMGIRVNIWISDTKPQDQIRHIGQRFKELLRLNPKDEIEFSPHDSAYKADQFFV
jgi:translation initiation factor 4E